MQWMFIALGLLVLLVVLGALVVSIQRSRSIGASDRARLDKEWAHAVSLAAPDAQISEAEKVLDHAFALLGAKGSFADKLRALGPRLGDAQAVWNIHKLRNRLAHEPGVHATASDAKRALAIFRRAIDDLT